MGRGLATIDRLPTVSLVLQKLQTRDKDCHIQCRETLGLKHITNWTALDIGRSCYKRSSTLTVRKPYKQCVLCFHSKNFIPFFEERSHHRTTVECKWNVNFLLAPTVRFAVRRFCPGYCSHLYRVWLARLLSLPPSTTPHPFHTRIAYHMCKTQIMHMCFETVQVIQRT